MQIAIVGFMAAFFFFAPLFVKVYLQQQLYSTAIWLLKF